MNTLLWWLAQNTLTLAIMIPLVALACRLFRHRPAVQHVLWAIVLVKFLTPPLVVWPWSLDEVRTSLWSPPVAMENARDSAAAANSAYDFKLPSLPPEVAQLERARAATDRYVELTDLELAELAALEVDSHRAEALSQPTTILGASLEVVQRLLWIAPGIWLFGAAVCAGRHARRIARHVSLLRQAAPAAPPLKGEIATIARSLGLQPPRALLSRRIRSPFVWCLGGVRLVWPLALASDAEVVRSRGIIAHELAHIRRGDHWAAWLELAAGVVWWWNPLFWFARKRLRESAEMACDALAIAAFPEQRAEYAELLLELSAGCESSLPAPVLAVGALSPASFERRLTMILSERASGRVSSWGILTAICLALVALPGWAIGQAPAPEKTTPSAAPPSAANNRTTEPVAEGAATAEAADTTEGAAPAAANDGAFKLIADTFNKAVAVDEKAVSPEDANARIKKLEAENQLLRQRLQALEQKTESRKYPVKQLVDENNPVLKYRYSRATANKMPGKPREKLDPSEKLGASEAYTRATADLQTVRKRWEELQAQQPAASPELLDQAKRDLVVAEDQLRQIVQLLKQQQVDAKIADQERLAADSDYTELLKRFPKGPSKGEGDSAAALLKLAQARAIEQQQVQQSLVEQAAAQAKIAEQQLQFQGQDTAVKRGQKRSQQEAQVQFTNNKSLAQPAPDNPLDVAERYLRAEADLKTAKGRLGRLKKPEASGVVPQQDIEELEIELERAEKLCRLLTTYIQEARKSAVAAKDAVQNEYIRAEQLYKASAISRSELEAAKTRIDEADARVRQFDALNTIVPQATFTTPPATIDVQKK